MPETRFIDPRSCRGSFEDLAPSRRPHVVFITADMVPPDVYRPGELNGGLVRTPNLDMLRAGGVTFTNAFANSPLCGPSRASYLTGRYPYVLVNEERAHDGFAVSLRADDVIFPEYLRAAGYVTKHAGKCHVGAAKFFDAFGENDAAWNRWAPPMTDDDGYVAFLKRLGVSPPVWPDPIRGVRTDRKTPGNNYGGFVTGRGGAPFPEEASYSHYLAALAVERLDGALAQGVASGAPLYLEVDFFAPHQPFMIPAGLRRRAGELRRKVRIPESFRRARAAGPDASEPRIYEFYRREVGIYDEAVLREYIVCNFLEMEVLDRAIGKVIAALKKRRLYDDALVIFAADHGEMNGELTLVDKGAYAHPRVARVPLVVKPPRGASRGTARRRRNIDTPVCLLDVAPTILAAAGVRPHAHLDGLSLLPFLGGARPVKGLWKDRTFIFEAFWHMGPNPAVAFQWRKSPREHYWYAYNLTGGRDELYDLADASCRNLASDGRYAATRRAMIRRLAAFLRADPRWRCYWHAMRIDMQADLPPDAGDHQMFRPE